MFKHLGEKTLTNMWKIEQNFKDNFRFLENHASEKERQLLIQEK